MVELYNYQEGMLHQVQDALGNEPKARVMMQLPTGGGKTEIAGQLLKTPTYGWTESRLGDTPQRVDRAIMRKTHSRWRSGESQQILGHKRS